MKTLKLVGTVILSIFILNGSLEAQVNKTTPEETRKMVKEKYRFITISPFGGAIFPLPKSLNQNFKPGGTVGMDIGYRLNREVGFYAQLGYYFMSSKITGAPVGAYLEATAGPRYFFTHPKLKSSFYFEGGVGAYNFRQNSYVQPGDTNMAVISQISDTKAGLNGGIGANLSLTNALDILVKSKYHVIFTPNGTSSFITVVGGLELKFR